MECVKYLIRAVSSVLHELSVRLWQQTNTSLHVRVALRSEEWRCLAAEPRKVSGAALALFRRAPV